MSKGSTPRPLSVSQETYAERWERTFGQGYQPAVYLSAREVRELYPPRQEGAPDALAVALHVIAAASASEGGVDFLAPERVWKKVQAELPAEVGLAFLRNLVGTVTAPVDWAKEHDHYLYGSPKAGAAPTEADAAPEPKGR